MDASGIRLVHEEVAETKSIAGMRNIDFTLPLDVVHARLWNACQSDSSQIINGEGHLMATALRVVYLQGGHYLIICAEHH